jgi:hypothetical protein
MRHAASRSGRVAGAAGRGRSAHGQVEHGKPIAGAKRSLFKKRADLRYR